MQRLAAIEPEQATGKAKELLDATKAQLGMVPNLMKTLASSPAALEGYLSFSGALHHGLLRGKLREEISVLVAEINGCEYCSAAHTAIGKGIGISDDALIEARRGGSSDPKIDAALKFAALVLQQRGKVSDEAVAAVRAAGYSDGEIAEIVANVSVNVLTNYFNNVANTVVDFPPVVPLAK